MCPYSSHIDHHEICTCKGRTISNVKALALNAFPVTWHVPLTAHQPYVTHVSVFLEAHVHMGATQHQRNVLGHQMIVLQHQRIVLRRAGEEGTSAVPLCESQSWDHAHHWSFFLLLWFHLIKITTLAVAHWGNNHALCSSSQPCTVDKSDSFGRAEGQIPSSSHWHLYCPHSTVTPPPHRAIFHQLNLWLWLRPEYKPILMTYCEWESAWHKSSAWWDRGDFFGSPLLPLPIIMQYFLKALKCKPGNKRSPILVFHIFFMPAGALKENQ